MPHLDAAGLSESWLFRYAGDLHWEAIARRLASRTDEIRGDGGRAALPDGGGGARPLRRRAGRRARERRARRRPSRWSRAGAPARTAACRRASALTAAPSAAALRAGAADHLRRARGGRGDAHGAAGGAPGARAGAPVGAEPPIARLARAARRGEPLDDRFSGPCDPLLGPPLARGRCADREVRYEPSPYADYNGAGLLYFASYVSIADASERQLVRRLGLGVRGRARRGVDWALATSPVRRDVFYYENLPLGASLTAALMAFVADERGVTTRMRLSRAARSAGTTPARAMADVVTRRLFVSDRAGGRAAEWTVSPPAGTSHGHARPVGRVAPRRRWPRRRGARRLSIRPLHLLDAPARQRRAHRAPGRRAGRRRPRRHRVRARQGRRAASSARCARACAWSRPRRAPASTAALVAPARRRAGVVPDRARARARPSSRRGLPDRRRAAGRARPRP